MGYCFHWIYGKIFCGQNSPATDAFRFSPDVTLYKAYEDRPPVKVHLITNLDEGLDRIQFGMSIMDRLIPIAIAIAALMIVYNLIGVFTTYKVRQAYGWSIFTAQGASIPKRGIYATFINRARPNRLEHNSHAPTLSSLPSLSQNEHLFLSGNSITNAWRHILYPQV